MDWPDIAVGLLLAMGAFRGWRLGLIAELTGTLALGVALVAAFSYNGSWDSFAADRTHLGPGSAHVVALLGYAVVAYAFVAAAGFALGRVAKLPLINTANAALGSLFGVAKGVLFVWAILYVALFFPLSQDLRDDLHRSFFAQIIASHNTGLDETLRSSLPWFVKPFSGDMFARHRV